MPEYLAPGVYIEEISIGTKPIEGVSTSNAGFLGMTERGPTSIRLVTSFGQYQQLYGGHIDGSYMPYAVDAFFRNGGSRCYIGRVVKKGADEASLKYDALKDLESVGPGKWGDRVAIQISLASTVRRDPNDPNSPDPADEKKDKIFKLTIAYWEKDPKLYGSPPPSLEELLDKASVLEVYDDLSIESSSPNYYVTKVNAASKLVKFDPDSTPAGTGRPNNTYPLFIPLTEGKDGDPLELDGFKGDPTAAPDKKVGLAAFEQVDEINMLYAPDLHYLANQSEKDALIDEIVSHCQNMKDRFAILDISKGQSNVNSVNPPKDSTFAAVYYPWIESFDPLKRGPILLPPGGSMAGIYARTDQQRGVFKAPANEVVLGALDLEFIITKGEQDILNPRGVNVIRSFPGRGIRIWGARTTSSDPEWKYINVRRLFLFLEESIEEGTQWVVFEPNNERLWARVKQSITQFLITQWRLGALMGTTPEEAFFVKVDRSTMTQDDIDNGRLIILIGVAPTKPAEFVIIRIAQFTAEAQPT